MKAERFIKNGLKSGYSVKELVIARSKHKISKESFDSLIDDIKNKHPWKNFIYSKLINNNNKTIPLNLSLLSIFYVSLLAIIIGYNLVFGNAFITNIALIGISLLSLIILGPWLVMLYLIVPSIGLGYPVRLEFFNLGFGFHLNEIVIIFAVVLFFIPFLLLTIKKRNIFKKFNTGMELPILLFFIAIIISAFNSNNISSFFKTAGQFFIAFLLFYFVYFHLDNKRKVRQLAWVIFIVFFAASIVSIISMNPTVYKFLANLIGFEVGTERINGFWSQHNLTTIYNFGMIMGYAIFIHSRKRIHQFFSLAATAAISFALLISNTRTNYVAFISILVLFGIFTKHKKKYLVGLFIILFTSFGAFSIFGQGFDRWDTAVLTGGAVIENNKVERAAPNFITGSAIEKPEQEFSPLTVFPKSRSKGWIEDKGYLVVHQSDSRSEGIPFVDYIARESTLNQYTKGRFTLGRVGLAVYNQYPLIGNSFSSQYVHIQHGSERFDPGLHNFYIQLLASTGIIGFLTFMFLLYNTFRKDFNLFLKNKYRNNVFILAFSLGSLAMLIDGIAQNGPFYWNILFMFFIYRGVIHAYSDKIVKKGRSLF